MNPTSFSVILLPTLHCDARCDYCFEDNNTGKMNLESFSELLEKLFDFMDHRDISLLNLYWQGGEVFTLTPEWFYAANDQMISIAQRRGRSLANFLQSNLLSYDKKWEPIVRDIFGGSIGTSMDFPNRHRRLIKVSRSVSLRYQVSRLLSVEPRLSTISLLKRLVSATFRSIHPFQVEP